MIFTASSIKKLTPMKLKIKAGTVIPSVIKCFKKNTKTPRINTAVFTMGHDTAESATAKVVFFDFNALNIRPATRPDIAPFTSTVIIVPGMDNAKNGPASPDTKTANPKTSPSHAPAFQPKSAAPITMGTSERVIEKVPVLMNILMYCKTNVIAVSTAYITKFLVDIAFFVFDIKIPPWLPSWYQVQRLNLFSTVLFVNNTKTVQKQIFV